MAKKKQVRTKVCPYCRKKFGVSRLEAHIKGCSVRIEQEKKAATAIYV